MKNAELLLREADQMLEAAQQEMNRSEEDTIAHTVCFNSRQSLLNYLTVFLLDNGVEPQDPATMAGLLEQCREVDSRFNLIQLDNIHCRFESDHQDYCLDVAQVDECFQVATLARGLVTASERKY